MADLEPPEPEPQTVNARIDVVVNGIESYEVGTVELTEDEHMQQLADALRRIATEIENGDHDV